MKIRDLFQREIDRTINGVVKADQLDESSVWQELDEFVVTRELTGHFSALVDALKDGIQSKAGSEDRNGVWVSGFFGCGKSHFIKVLSYLLENHQHSYEGESKRAVEFFEGKIQDSMLYADLKQVVSAPTDAILFNVDSKADHRTGRDALVRVLLKVLNEKQGYSGDHPHIAHMERFLDGKGKLETFATAYERASGASWLEERDAWEFHRDEVVKALEETLGQSGASVEAWVDNAEGNFSVTVENLAKWVLRYLDSQGPEHRIVFLIDEVGQFVGNDTHIMLNLQTITETLGTICKGRAWIVVTSQEDLDAVLGDLKEHKQHDFSKIQGRFKTRLSLSSANVDEVIKERLLDKNASAPGPLAAAYEGKADILRHSLDFVNAGMAFKHFADSSDFAACYPFAAYQFTLVQKVFESIRKAGATGLHLAQGERSILDAFQSAAKQLADEQIGALAPFYSFYPSVEGFLDTKVKRTIQQAADNHALEPFDITLLKVLFLIRYIDELPGSVDNLATLCVDEIDADKIPLRKQIEESLARLEGQTLVARNGDLYFFLTDEERDIGREIKKQLVPSGAEERELGRLIFEDVLGDVRKYTYQEAGRDFAYNRMCDDQYIGNRMDGSLEVAFTSPLGDSYAGFASDEACVMNTINNGSRVLVKLPDDDTLGRELRVYLQTESYVRTKNTGSLPESTKTILRNRSEDNRERRGRILIQLREMLADARYFAGGQALELGSKDPKAALGLALESLIQNAYSKMAYIEHRQQNPKQEIQSTLRANDLETQGMLIAKGEANPKAIADLREYIRLCDQTAKQTVLHDLITKRYEQMPYGWPELEVVLLVARLAVLREIHLVVDGADLPLESAYEHLTASNKQRKVVITRRVVADQDVIRKAQEMGKQLFGAQGPNAEDALFTHLQGKLKEWGADLASYEPFAVTGNYPGHGTILEALQTLRKFVEEKNSLKFLRRFIECKDELSDLSEDYQELLGFYKNQRRSWEALREAVTKLGQNRLQLDPHPKAGPALARMEEILKAERPYGMLQESQGLIHTASEVNDQLISDARKPAMAAIQGFLDSVKVELDKAVASADLRAAATGELTRLLETAATTATSIAHISEAAKTAEDAYDRALSAIEKAQVPPVPPDKPTPPGEDPPPPPPPAIKPRRQVNPKDAWPGGFIETQSDVDTYLGKLRTELEDGIQAGERIQLK